MLSLALVLTTLEFTGCGSSDTIDSATNRGYYIDSAVSGAEYLCGSFKGITDSDGKFYFEDGKDCNFSVAGIPLREVQANRLRDKISIVEDNLTIATFLQTLDYDGDASNGIEINADVVKALQNIEMKSVPYGDVNLSNMISDISSQTEAYRGKLVSETEALQHLKQTQVTTTRELLAGKTFFIVFDDSPGIFKLVFNDDVTLSEVSGVDGSFTVDSNISLDGDSIIWPSNKISTVKSYISNYITLINHYSDGTFNYSYLFSNVDEANTFAKALINAIPVSSTDSGTSSGLVQVVAPADPSQLDLISYDVLIFYKNTAYSKYNYYAQAPDKLVSLLTSSVDCLDYNFTDAQKVQTNIQDGVATTTYFNAEEHRTCIESDYANATDNNLSGTMEFVVYYNK